MTQEAEVVADAEARLARARALIKVRAPYVAATIYGFIPYMQWGLKTMGVTENLVLVVDPEWLCSIQDKHIAAGLFHESMHVVRDHIARMKNFPDHEMANKAADLAINGWMRDAGWELPHAIYPDDYGFPPDLSMEEYYKLLDQRQKKQQKKQKKRQGQGQGGGQGQAQGHGMQGSEGQGGQTDPGEEDPDQSKPGLGCGRCGSVAGNPLEKEASVTDPGRSEVDVKNIVKQTMVAIKQWAEAHGRGSVPGGLLKDIENALQEESDIPWQQELTHVTKKCTGIIESGGMDYSLARPSKRSYARGFPRPGLVQYIPEVAFALDTSGSMGKPQVIESLVHCIGICKTLGVEVVSLIQADAGVHDIKRVRLRDFMGRVQIRGGGGTNFDPALQAAEKLKPRPDLLFYMTDGDGHASYKPKGIQVIWVVVRSYYNKKPCDWGHTVVVAEKGKRGTRPVTEDFTSL